jgi:mannitol/fructose-specific phosphotransferase system IIA component (Ntr-type)
MTVFSVLALGLAFILSGIFEQAGLAMIIGAYVMGLSLSKTDISYVIQEHLHTIHEFFVPIFFTVMGMMVNISTFFSVHVLLIGIFYSLAAILGKVVGGGIPSLFLKFNKLGALRIGLGLVPRGEVALIIAGIGLSTGSIGEDMFGVSVMMVLLAILVAPPLLEKVLKIEASGTTEELGESNLITTLFEYPSEELTEFLVTKIILEMKEEGFYIHTMDAGKKIYQMRKEEMFITMVQTSMTVSITSRIKDVGFVKTMVYESLLELHETVNKLKDTAKPESLQKDLTRETEAAAFDIFRYLDTDCLTVDLVSESKNDVIKEMLQMMEDAGKLKDRQLCEKALLEREAIMSTGMQYGIAIPHGKSLGVDTLRAAVGIKKEGIEFESIDGELCRLFIMVLSPKQNAGPHIQFLSSISAILNSEEAREKILQSSSKEQLLKNLKTYSVRK